MKEKIIQFWLGFDKKEALKVAGTAVTRLLDLSSRLIFQLPNEKDSALVRNFKYVAMTDSVYKALVKGDEEDEETVGDRFEEDSSEHTTAMVKWTDPDA